MLDWRNGATLDLIAQSLATGKTLRLSVGGESMAPFLRPGDAVLLRREPGGIYAPGDLVTCWFSSELVTHRVVQVTRDSYLTKGDRSFNLDPPVSREQVLGRVICIERAGRMLNMDNAAWTRINHWLAGCSRLEAQVNRSLAGLRWRYLSWGVAGLLRLPLWLVVVFRRWRYVEG